VGRANIPSLSKKTGEIRLAYFGGERGQDQVPRTAVSRGKH